VVLGTLIGGLLAGGCGPIGYTINILEAHQAVEEARQANAADLAPYEYYYALEHLNASREEANEAEYQHSIDLANTAKQYGERARDLARRRARESGR
jgi:hypothetical protein